MTSAVSPAPHDSAPAKLRVLFIANFFPKPTNPAMGVWALTQAKALAAQDIELRIVSFSSWMPRWAGAVSSGARAYSHCPARFEWQGLAVDYPRWILAPVGPLKRRAFENPEPQMALAWASARPFVNRLVKDWRPDIVFAHHTMAGGYLAEKIKARWGVPFVTLDHDFGEISACEQFPARRATFERIAGAAEFSLCVSSRMEKTLASLFPKARAATQHNGVADLPPDVWKTPRPPEMAGKTVILSAGMFYERKGFTLLLEAFAQVAPRFPDAILRLAGSGPLQGEIEATRARLGLENCVELLGLLPHESLVQEMVWADGFALIGWDEPFATVFLEAAAARCPLVWSRDGGVSDVLENGVHGWSVAPRDLDSAATALAALLEDPARRDEVAQNTRKLFENQLRAEAVAAQLVDRFRAVSSG